MELCFLRNKSLLWPNRMIKFIIKKILSLFEGKEVPLPNDVSLPPQPEPIRLTPPPTILQTPRERLYEVAKATLGTDASPKDEAPDDLACAESVNAIYKKAFGYPITQPGLSTTALYIAMLNRFKEFSRVE